MLTCSATAAAAVAAWRYTLINNNTRLQLKSFLEPLTLSSSYSLFSQRIRCVHKLATQPQNFLPSVESLCPSSSICSVEVRRHRHSNSLPSHHKDHHHHHVSLSRRKRNTSHCCLLNLNHHISFHYINSSIFIRNKALHHHCFHHSVSATAGSGSGTTDSSINHNSLFEAVVNNEAQMSKAQLSMSDKLKVNEDGDDEEDEEYLQDQVWSTGPAVIPTFNVGAYANDSDNAKKLILLGVNLSKWEGRYGTIPILYKSNFERDLEPTIRFLQTLGVEGTDLSHLLSENPFIFNEDVRNLKKRVEYLRLKKFSYDSIINIVTNNPYWLSLSVPRIDRRLGFYQTHFKLTGDQVRKLASAGTSGPKLITYHLGRVKDVTFTIKEEMGFTSEEIVKLLLARPRIWKEVPASLRRRFDYLHNEENFPHADFIRWPWLLLQRERRMRERIGFLKKLGRAQFDPTKPNYVSVEKLCYGIDAEFATDVAKVGAVEYNNYLKTL